MATLTIHTASYNRAYILGKAYESLKSQTCKDFEWIITDDGSTDNTEELVNEWKNNNNGFPICYYKIPHTGKPRAVNYGITKTSSPWFMMLDSDDMILPTTVEKVIQWLKEIEGQPKIGGIGFAKCYPDGQYMKNQEPIMGKSGYVDASHLERGKYNLDMDMCEVHRTELFRLFPFQCWETENFAPEQLNYYELAFAGWKLRWRKDKLYICDYLADGLTKDNGLVLNNPMGFAMMYNQNIIICNNLLRKCFCAIQMTALAIFSGNIAYLIKSNSPFLTFLTFPFGAILAIRRTLQYRKLSKK